MQRVDLDRLKALAAEGYSQSTCADIFGVTREWIRQLKDLHEIEFQNGGMNIDLRDDVAALYADGMCDTEIARKLGRAKSVVRHHRVSIGLPPNKKKKSKWEVPIRKCAETGMTVKEAAAHLGIPQPTVSFIKKKFGIEFRRDGRSAT